MRSAPMKSSSPQPAAEIAADVGAERGERDREATRPMTWPSSSGVIARQRCRLVIEAAVLAPGSRAEGRRAREAPGRCPVRTRDRPGTPRARRIGRGATVAAIPTLEPEVRMSTDVGSCRFGGDAGTEHDRHGARGRDAARLRRRSRQELLSEPRMAVGHRPGRQRRHADGAVHAAALAVLDPVRQGRHNG